MGIFQNFMNLINKKTQEKSPDNKVFDDDILKWAVEDPKKLEGRFLALHHMSLINKQEKSLDPKDFDGDISKWDLGGPEKLADMVLDLRYSRGELTREELEAYTQKQIAKWDIEEVRLMSRVMSLDAGEMNDFMTRSKEPSKEEKALERKKSHEILDSIEAKREENRPMREYVESLMPDKDTTGLSVNNLSADKIVEKINELRAPQDTTSKKNNLK